MNRLITLAAAALLFVPAIAHGQTQTARTYQGQDGQTKEAQGTFCVPDTAGNGCAAGGGSTRSTAAGTSDTQAVPVQGVTNGVPQRMMGDVASGTTDAGSPIKVGGLANTNAPAAVANGQRVAAWYSQNGAAFAQLAFNGIPIAAVYPTVDGVNLSSSAIIGTMAAGHVFNGASWDRQRGDTVGTYVVQQTVANAGAGVAPVASTAVEAGRVAKASAGNLYGLNVATGGTAGYVLVLNATAIPADGAVTPLKCYAIAANTSLDLNLRAAPIYFSTGITVLFSTTGCFTKTASATAFISADAK